MAKLGLGRGGHVDLDCVLMDLKRIMHNYTYVGCRIESIFVLIWRGLNKPYHGVEKQICTHANFNMDTL